MIRHSYIIFSLIALNMLLLLLGIGLGSSNIDFSDSLSALFGSSEKSNITYIIQEIRFPRTITAGLVGSGLAATGLMMQTLFMNPLAGPYILGVSSGASLGVAFITMTGLIGIQMGIPMMAILGALLSGLMILTASKWIKDSLVLLIVGVMLASLTSAITGVLTYFSNPEDLKSFVLWSLGDFGKITLDGLPQFSALMLLGILASLLCIKPLNAYLVGEQYISSAGFSSKSIRTYIILITAWIVGISTAYCGPIAFIGLAVPNLVRFIVKTSNHRIMMPVTLLTGSLLGVLCDIIARVPGNEISLPINAITAIVGAPIVIIVLIRNRNIRYQ